MPEMEKREALIFSFALLQDLALASRNQFGALLVPGARCGASLAEMSGKAAHPWKQKEENKNER